jgi:hypothetical protein
MALPGRSGRRGGAGFRWIAAGVVITLVVLLIDASLNSRSPRPQEALASGSWVDRVVPEITTSNAESQVLNQLWSGGLKMPPAQLESSMEQLASGSARAYATVVALRPPTSLAGPAGLLEAALLARSRAAGELQKALIATLGSAAATPGTKVTANATAVDPATVVPDVTQAGSDIQIGDQAYQLFLSSLPTSLGVRFPPSAWGSDPAAYTAAAAQVFLTTLQNGVVTTPVYQVKIFGITTTPGPVSTSGATQILPDATAMILNVVMANTGNQPLQNLTVTAAINPAGHGSSSVRDFVNLEVGQAYTINDLGPLNPPQGVPVTLTVTVSSARQAGLQALPQTITFQMPAPPVPTTTSPTTTPGRVAPPTT